MSSNVVDLSEKILALSPPDKLRLAAALLEERKPELALRLAGMVTAELGAVLTINAREPIASAEPERKP